MTQVVIDDIIPRTQLIAIAGQTVFNTNWTADEASDILVYARAEGESADDATQLVDSSLYNVTFIGASETVRVTFLSGRAEGDIITIVRDTPASRLNLYSNTNFLPSMLNQDFGILTLVDQQAQMYDTVINPGYNKSETIEPQDKVLPKLRPLEVWRMNEDGTAIETVEIDELPPPSTAPYLVYRAAPELPSAQNLGLLSGGLLKQSVVGGTATLAIATPGIDYIPGTPALGTMAYQNANNVNITGGSGIFTSGQVLSSPLLPDDLVNKLYADTIASGFSFKSAVIAATTADLDATYDNGASGVGATLTANNNGVLSVDGESPTFFQRVLVKDQLNQAENGVYVVSDPGSVSNPFILTRATDFDSSAEITPGAIVFVQEGATYADTSFVETDPVINVGSDPIIFVQFSQQYPLSMGNGGTGASITPISNAVFSTDGSSVGQLSTTLPSGLIIPGYATSGANTNITSMSGLTGLVRTTATNAVQLGSENTTTPLVLQSGTGLQHTTNFLVSNTANTRNVTVQDADGVLAYLSDIGATRIATSIASNSAFIDLTGMTGYTNYVIYYSDFVPATNGSNLRIVFSDDNGVNYITTNNYRYELTRMNNSTLTTQAVTGQSAITLSSGHNNSAGVSGAGIIQIFNPNGAFLTTIVSQSFYIDSGAGLNNFFSGGQITLTNAIDAVRFIMSAGNITTGNWQLYGLK
jgi:hypothetical protein